MFYGTDICLRNILHIQYEYGIYSHNTIMDLNNVMMLHHNELSLTIAI